MVVRKLLVKRRRNRVSDAAAMQRVTIGRRLRDDARRYRVAGAGAVLDDHLLAPELAHRSGENASETIGHTAGPRAEDQSHRFERIARSLRLAEGARAAREQQQQRSNTEAHVTPPQFTFPARAVWTCDH